MSIICAVDFSEHSVEAVAVASALAASLHEPLSLVHALEPFGWVTQLPHVQAPMLKAIHEILGGTAAPVSPIDVLVTHVYRQLEEGQRRGIKGPMEVEPINPETERALTHDLAARVRRTAR